MTKLRRLALVFSALLLLSGCASGAYEIGEHDAPLGFEQSVEGTAGVAVLSTQTQYQLLNNQYIYFIREGALNGDLSQMIKIYRAAGIPILGTNSTSREYQAVQVPPGKYTLYAHSIGYFGNIVPGASIQSPYRGLYAGTVYPRGLINFEVTSGKAIYIGDIWLEAPYSEGDIEPDTREMKDLSIRLGESRLDEAKEFLQRFSSVNRTLTHRTTISDSMKSNVKCEHHEGELVRPWTCPDE